MRRLRRLITLPLIPVFLLLNYLILWPICSVVVYIIGNTPSGARPAPPQYTEHGDGPVNR